MSNCRIIKCIERVNPNKKHIIAVAMVAMVMSVFVNCEESYSATRKESIGVSTPASTEVESLSKEIKLLVKELEYSDKVAEDFVNMVISWKDKQGRPVLIIWKKKLARAKEDYKQGKISIDRLVKAEESIIGEFSQRTRKEISYNEKFFDLADVIKHKQAQCVGYAQLVYILGNSIGLSVKAINVVKLATGTLERKGHAACIISLADGKRLMVDTWGVGGVVGRPFKTEKEFRKVGNYWELKDKDNPLQIHRRVQMLDRNGLIAFIYINRGATYSKLGQCHKAISDYTRAIELNPECALAYYGRGATYVKLGQYHKAISDCTRAIELNPECAEAYYGRGIAYIYLKKTEEAKKDLVKAVELEPSYKASIKEISYQHKLDLKLD